MPILFPQVGAPDAVAQRIVAVAPHPITVAIAFDFA